MTIKILKSEIFNEVEKRSSIEGFSIPERFDNIWADQSRGDLLDSYWIEGCEAVAQIVKRYLTSKTVSHNLTQYDKDEVLSIELKLPCRHSFLLDGSIETCIKMLVACNVLHGWLEVVSPESASKYLEETSAYSNDLKSKIYYRVAPKRDMVYEKNIDDTPVIQGRCV